MAKSPQRPKKANTKRVKIERYGAVCAPRGSLLIIGGHENREGHCPILKEIARRSGSGKLVVATIASEDPQPQWEEYKKVFTDLGVRHIQQLDVRQREELMNNHKAGL